MENQNAQNLAEKIARLLQTDQPNADYQSLQSSLERINQRLDNIESQIALQKTETKDPRPSSNHSSQEKFLDLEELAVETINGFKDEKACPYEPTGKPCDHCAMCNSRGF